MMRIEPLWQDARYAVRGMRKRPRFTILAVATLALGIGVNVASLAVAYGILLRPLPYAEPSRIVILNLLFSDGGDLGFSPEELQKWLPRLRTVETAAGYYTSEVTIRSGHRSTVVPAAIVTDHFFDVLGTAPELGRARLPTDSPEVVVGHRAIAQLLGDTRVQPLGTLLSVSETGRSIAGVMPSAFAFPNDEIGVWLPSTVLKPGTKSEDSGYSRIVARLKPGVTLEQVRGDANRIRRELDPSSRDMVSVVLLGESVVEGMYALLTAVATGALLVLVVACANVATLLIGRDIAQERELAARLALGASRAQLVRGMLVETALLAGLATIVGTGVGAAALTIFRSYAAGTMTGLHRVAMDVPVVVAVAGLTSLVTLLCGLFRAWYAARVDFSPFLRAAIGSHRRAGRIRGALVIAQIALSCVLLIGAGLLARTVSVLLNQDHGFRTAGALEARVVLSDIALFNGAGRQVFVRDLLERVRALPGVRYAGFGSNLPPRPPPGLISIRLVRDDRDESRFMKIGAGTPGYLRALGAQFIAGRDFEDRDNRPDVPVVVLSESVADFYFRREDPIGRTLQAVGGLFGLRRDPRVIGVVRDVQYDGLDSPAGSAIYLLWSQRPFGQGYLIVRSQDDPMRLAGTIRTLARDLDPTVPIPEMQTLEDAMAQSVAGRRVRALPAIGFGVLALAVACVGVLATLMTLVAERRRDLAIRSALGASPRQLTWIILGQGLILTAAGLGIGLGIGSAAAKALSSLLYGVSPFDVATFAGAALLIGCGAILTTYVAAVGARRVDPLVILKSE
jgi:predicted permease